MSKQADIEKAYAELSDIDYKNSKEKTEIASRLCEKAGLLVSDLVEYEQYLLKTGNQPPPVKG